jgi:hypothetical protein
MSLGGCRSESVMMRGMVIDRQEARLHILAQVKAFLDGTAEGAFRVPKTEGHRFIERVLTRFGYAQQGRVGKSVLLRYLERMTRLSRQQVTRLVRQYRQDGTLSCRHGAPRHAFPSRFTATDVALLADMDALHDTVSGPATKKLSVIMRNCPRSSCEVAPSPTTKGGETMDLAEAVAPQDLLCARDLQLRRMGCCEKTAYERCWRGCSEASGSNPLRGTSAWRAIP